MIKLQFLSDVEATYVRGEARYGSNRIPRVFGVWADVGLDVHGFAAVAQSIRVDGSDFVVTFKPVTDIEVLRHRVVRHGPITLPDGTTGWDQTISDPRKYQPVDVTACICMISASLDTATLSALPPLMSGDLELVCNVTFDGCRWERRA